MAQNEDRKLVVEAVSQDSSVQYQVFMYKKQNSFDEQLKQVTKK